MREKRYRRVAFALLTALPLASCETPHGGDGIYPKPLRSVVVAGVAAGAAINLRATNGKPDVRPLSAAAFSDGSLTWLGHSSFLVRAGGKIILTDPMFSTRPELPVLVRPHRIAPPPPGLDRLDRLDAVLISHVDHDHLDIRTLRALSAKFPSAVLLAPIGTRDLVAKSGFAHVEEYGVDGSRRLGGVRFTALPARHYGRRDMVGLNRRLAIGWEIAAAGRRIYFSGDTGYGPEFKALRAQRGAYDIALVPIGAYAPERVFNHVHATPEEALAIAADLGAPVAIGHHWGTFAFGTETPREAEARFLAARQPGTTARTLAIGETIRIR
ncbi:MAG: MBL fold metallo-hydrolase [Oricola sp.]